MKKSLGTMVAIMVVAIISGLFITAKYSNAVDIGKDSRFIAYDNGTVLDTKTNLLWAVKDNGSNINWSDAKSYCENYKGGGYTDWRLPTKNELKSLYDDTIFGNNGYHLTKLINLSGTFVWSSEMTGPKPFVTSFLYGLAYEETSSNARRNRALPVRSAGGETAAVNVPDAEVPTAAVASADTTTGKAKQWWEKGYIPPPKVEEPVAPVEVTPPPVETTPAPVEVAAPPAEAPVAPAEAVAPQVEAPAAPVEVAAPKVEKPVTEKVSMPLNLKFDTAKSDINKKYDKDIKKVADLLKANPEATAVIEGHTDNVDIHNEPERNMRLSQARADSVRQYLIDTFGIDASRVTAVGYGPNKPIASNDTAEGKKKNRRVEAVIEMVKPK
ncbi:outer membrane protein a precursor [hydrocarbon metagenome]|uniref:Outer membrane protein a n=1 Tax=hydrocarbon metagenome TaxID=938273 RepID=A0A0W8FPX2_9ZZZZ